MTNEPLLTSREAAKYLNVHPQGLYRWDRDGRLKALRVGNKLRYTKKMLDDFAGIKSWGEQEESAHPV